MINKAKMVQALMEQADSSYGDMKSLHQGELDNFSQEAKSKQDIVLELFDSVGNIDEMILELEDQLELIDESTAEETQVKISMMKLIQALSGAMDDYSVLLTIIAQQSDKQENYLGVYQRALKLMIDQFDLPEDPALVEEILKRVLLGEDVELVIQELTKDQIIEQTTPPTDQLPAEETSTGNTQISPQEQARILIEEELKQSQGVK